jgi:hypothetical protein
LQMLFGRMDAEAKTGAPESFPIQRPPHW